MSRHTTFVIVGGGLAGAKAAEALRAEGFDGRLVLLGTQVHRPYEQPPLSKGYLQGTSERDDIYAAGDVANAYHPLLRRHLGGEHWANASNQPAVVAQSMLGRFAV